MARVSRQTTDQSRRKKQLAGEDQVDRKLKAERLELATASGTVTKDKVYYINLAKKIALNLGHPKHHNVRMQAHHIISEKAIKLAGKKYIDELLLLGFNINDLENLCFIPSTLQGACHLGVQPHIGNHAASIRPEYRDPESSSYDDDDEPYEYHDMVRDKLIETLNQLRGSCPSISPSAYADAKTRLHALSMKILAKIGSKPFEAPLSNAYPAFEKGSLHGCAGESRIDKQKFINLRLPSCPVERDHHGNRQGDRQKPEGISIKKQVYKLNVGN